MTIFSNYARYYDLMYKEKDYAAEGDFVHSMIQEYAPQTRSILELGCGTGLHAAAMAEHGYRLCGIDRSPAMLDSAVRRLETLRPDLAERLSFSEGDIRTVRLKATFDVVISLFHVMSYQTTNEDVLASFITARQHLNRGGIFLFDCWFGPGVLSGKPTVRQKRFTDDHIEVTRTAEPHMDAVNNRTDVKYTILIRDTSRKTVEEVNEVHSMRYFFKPEIDLFASQAGLAVIHCAEWMSLREPGFDTWSACFILQYI
jgi:SAM-dependent methyltransferase